MPSQDTLSADDIGALIHAQQHLYAIGDPRATKLYNYILKQGYATRGSKGELQPAIDYDALAAQHGGTVQSPPVTLDFSKAQPLPAQGGVTLDFSKAVPLGPQKPYAAQRPDPYDKLASQHGGSAIQIDPKTGERISIDPATGERVGSAPAFGKTYLDDNGNPFQMKAGGNSEIQVTDEKGTLHVFPSGSTPEMIAKVLGVRPPSPKVYLDDNGNPIDGAAQGPAAAGFTPANIARNVGQGLKELGQGGVQMASDIGGAILPKAWGGDPWNNLQLLHHIVDPMQAEDAKAKDLWKTLQDARKLPNGPSRSAQVNQAATEYAGHVLASVLPVIGPYAAQLGQQAGSGDVGGALAKGATQLLAPKVVAPAASLAVRGAGTLAERAGLPEKLYQSALKPSTTLSPAERSSVAQTGIQNAIPVSAEGLEDLGNKIADLNQKIQAQIDADPTRQISTAQAIRNLRSVRAKFANQVNPWADVQAVNAAGREFAQQAPNGSLDASQAQAMKQGTYQALGGKSYGELKTASVEAQKALARGLKDEIANQFPELNNLNAQESKLFDLQPQLERAVGRIANQQLIGLSSPVTGTAVHAITGSGGAGLVGMVLKHVVDDPVVKSRLAISLSKAAKIPFAQANARVAAYSSALGPFASQSQSADATQEAQ